MAQNLQESTPQKITPRSENYSQWYLDVIRQGSLAEPAEVVKGCMVIKPHGYAIWEKIQQNLDKRFKDTGHENAYFPLFIPESFLKKEAEHIEGFSPELAVVTYAGGKQLEEPYVVRPTSETIIGYFFSKWIGSHRDLPLLINQWANVVRWELRTRMFLRTSEFLWQEGHTAHATHEESIAETLRMLDVYAQFAEEVMAMPVIKGVKTETEKFAGALTSYCIEAMMQDGKALQAGTSHDLGQNFGKAFDVKFQDQSGQLQYVWQTSWGVSTRLIGGLIMTHSDDNGLVLPPKLAPIQIVIIPIYRKEEEKAQTLEFSNTLAVSLKEKGLSVKLDARDNYKPGFKFFEWEQKGVPVRIEIGPKDMANNQVVIKRRDTGEKLFVSSASAVEKCNDLMIQIQKDLFEKAKKLRNDNTHIINSYDQFKEQIEKPTPGFLVCHWNGKKETEAKIKEETKATIRCSPLDTPDDNGKCIITGEPSKKRVVFARAY